MVAHRNTEQPSTVNPEDVLPFESIELGDLLEKQYQPLQWIIPGLLPEGLTLFFAGAKVGKSMASLFLMLRMICHLVLGGTVNGDVLYLSMDDPKQSRIQSRVRSLLGGMPLPVNRSKAHFVFTARELNAGFMLQMQWWMKRYPRTKLVVIDVYASIMPKPTGESIFRGDYKALEQLRTFAEEYHVAFLLLHHTNKRTKASDTEWTAGVNGSTGLLAACDTIWRIDQMPPSHKFLLRAKGRDVEESWLSIDMDDIESDWQEISSEGTDADGLTVQPLTSESENRIMELFVTLVTLTPKLAAEHTGLKPGTVRQCLRRLLARGLIEQTTYGAYRQVSVTSVTELQRDSMSQFVTLHDEEPGPIDYTEELLEADEDEGKPKRGPGVTLLRIPPDKDQDCPVCSSRQWGQRTYHGSILYYCRRCHPELKQVRRVQRS